MKIKIEVYDNFGLLLANREAEGFEEAKKTLDTIEKNWNYLQHELKEIK